MPPPLPIASAVYAFEGLLPDLESPPIAARRALDHAGLRLSVEAWRSLSLDERQRVTLVGVSDRVDVEAVAGLVRNASPGPQRVTPVVDPNPSAPPEALAKALEPTRAIDPKRWSRLRSVNRYALAHTYRRAVARSAFSLLGDAFDAVLAASAPPTIGGPPPLPGAYQPAGWYSNVGASPEPRDALPREGERMSSSIPPPYAQLYDHGAPARAAPAAVTAPGLGYDLAALVRGSMPAAPPEGALSNHLRPEGEVHMVDVARKPKTERRAIATGSVQMRTETVARIVGRDAPKGEVLATARVAAIMAAKRTSELIPLCHPVSLTHLEVDIEVDAPGAAVHVTVTADAYNRTGVEMEALVGASVGCLTIYDMLKGIDRDMVVSEIKLLEKSGGRSGHYQRGESKP